jgi:hypothetical protein
VSVAATPPLQLTSTLLLIITALKNGGERNGWESIPIKAIAIEDD